MKNILLPTDFSDTAINAMDYAVQLFKDELCTFYVLNTFTPVALYTTSIYEGNTSLNIDIGELYRQQSETNVSKAIDHIKSKYNNVKHTFQGVSSYNLLTLEIAEMVTGYNIDCIVMGTKGASGLKEVFLGSETMHVIKKATIPVIGVPDSYQYRDLKDVLFATDYNTGDTQKGLALLEELCASHISRLIFLNAYYGVQLDKNQLKNKEALNTYFKRDAHLNEIADGMDVLEAIEDFQSKHRIDLLVIVHNKHNFFENLLFTPVIRKIVHHSSVPFMILPPTSKI